MRRVCSLLVKKSKITYSQSNLLQYIKSKPNISKDSYKYSLNPSLFNTHVLTSDKSPFIRSNAPSDLSEKHPSLYEKQPVILDRPAVIKSLARSDSSKKHPIKKKDIGSIYVLKLEDDKYYVGFSKNVKTRIDQHFSGKGSYWTKIHKPIKVIKIYHNKDKGDEAIKTLKLMIKYGVQHVRGGPWSTYNTPIDIQRHLEDTCFKCGSDKHFAKHCKSQ